MNRRVGRAFCDYKMLVDGDRVLVAVSGGIDSLVLVWLLDLWQRKAPISYELVCAHVDMAHEDSKCGQIALAVRDRVRAFDLDLEIIPTLYQPDMVVDSVEKSNKDICFLCSHNRRNQLFELARQKECTKIAFGHHQDDILETFFLNLCYAGNISTMVPRQDLFRGKLAIIRPLAYLSKNEIEELGSRLGLQPVRSFCPLSEHTKRRDIRIFLEKMYQEFPGSRRHIFAALANVRMDYLLKQVNLDR